MNHSTNGSTEKSRIEERALHWFTLMRSDSLTDSDRAAYKTWLNANLAHRRAYRQLEELWGLVGDFADSPAVHEACVQARRFNPKAVHHLPPQPEAEAPTRAQTTTRSAPRHWLGAALAASLMLVFLGTNMISDTRWNPDTYQTAVGEQKTVLLEDGSTLVLDTQTRVAVRFSPEERRIVLQQGQARFDVAHNKHRPFVVEAGDGVITALGTAFVVKKVAGNNLGDEVLVTLLEGKVAVGRQQEAAKRLSADRHRPSEEHKDVAPQTRQPPTVTLEAGQQVAYSTERGLSQAAEVDLEQATAWQAGRLVFEGHSLANVVDDLNRYSRTRILLGDGTLESIKITGVFKTGDNQKVVQTLKSYFNIRVARDSNGNLVLFPAG